MLSVCFISYAITFAFECSYIMVYVSTNTYGKRKYPNESNSNFLSVCCKNSFILEECQKYLCSIHYYKYQMKYWSKKRSSETHKLAGFIPCILFLRLILAIKMISTIFKMANSILVERLILALNFQSIIFQCRLCLIFNSNTVQWIKYLFFPQLLIL